jgi:hypothetical protein
MLRALLLLLVAANLGYAAWWRGWLPADLLPLRRGDAGQREPGRVAAQRNPESIEVLAGPQAERLANARCLQAGPFSDEAWPGAEATAAGLGLAPDQWQRLPAATPASGAWLRVPQADPALQARLLAGTDAAFRPCP